MTFNQACMCNLVESLISFSSSGHIALPMDICLKRTIFRLETHEYMHFLHRPDLDLANLIEIVYHIQAWGGVGIYFTFIHTSYLEIQMYVSPILIALLHSVILIID